LSATVAQATEILGEKRTLLNVRERLMGGTRFDRLQRGLPLISPSLLSVLPKSPERARRSGFRGAGVSFEPESSSIQSDLKVVTMGSKTAFFLIVVSLLVSTTTSVADEWQGVQFLGMKSKVPAEWVGQPVTSSMRVLQFAVPGGEGSEAVQFVVYYFGPKQGGSVAANLARWKSQFSSPDGGQVEPRVSTLEDSRLPATLVELEGTYARGVGMGPQGAALAERMLLAAVVESPDGNLYPQLHGPAPAVKNARSAFVAFVAGIEPRIEP
jgi:hypothetical protein